MIQYLTGKGKFYIYIIRNFKKMRVQDRNQDSTV